MYLYLYSAVIYRLMLFLERNNVSLELSRLSVTTQAEISPLLTTLSNAMKNQLKAPKTPAFTYTIKTEQKARKVP